MKKLLLLIVVFQSASILKSQLPTYTFNVSASSNSVTCLNSIVSLTASNSGTISSASYTWYSQFQAPTTGANYSVTIPGIYTVVGTAASMLAMTQTIAIFSNTLAPISSVSPSIQSITCNLSSITNVTATAISPSINFTHKIIGPSGATFLGNINPQVYSPQAPGIYTYQLINQTSGCSTIKTFSVNSTQGYPIFNLVSPQNFSLGCSSKSVATVQFLNASSTNPPGVPVSFTILPPGANTITSGVLSTISIYTINSAGNYIAIAKDNSTGCEHRAAFTILSNTLGPIIDAIVVPKNVLDCATNTTTLTGLYSNTNAVGAWSYSNTTVAFDFVYVYSFTNTPTFTLINNYTFVLADNNNYCKTTTIIPMYQNLFAPNAIISASSNSITCTNSVVILTNNSTSNVPNNGIFSTGIAIAKLWSAPNQNTLAFTTNFTTTVVGIHTLQVIDISNSCESSTTINIFDGQIYPSVTQPHNPVSLDCSNLPTALSVTLTSPGSFSYSWTANSGAGIAGPTNSINLLVTSFGNYSVTVKDLNSGCKSTVEYYVSGCVGISENTALQKQFSIQPNPSNGNFVIENLNSQLNSKIEIYNTLGMLIKSINLKDSKNSISLLDEAAGIYFIKFFSNQKYLGTEKIIKE